jgi:glycine/D-amino acid oxidase-like deaminating enzyme
MTADVAQALADARPVPFWLDSSARPPARSETSVGGRCELAVVGGGFTGLWTALLAKEADPDRDVVLIDGGRIGWAASGRNGGFCAASLTHGAANGRSRFGAEYDQLAALGRQNLDEIGETVSRYSIDCNFERTGELTVATQAYQVEELREGEGEFLDQTAIRDEVYSPTYLAGAWSRDTTAMLEPAALAWGLAAAAEQLGVRIVEQSPVLNLRRTPSGVQLLTEHGSIQADHVALATNAFRPLLRRISLHTVPVWDYVLVTEPLSADQLASIGWSHRQGIGDSGNQFHYYRLTRDNRILWGGYDAIYHYGRRLRTADDQRPATFHRLAQHFFATFPQLTGLRFTHKWGGAIDTCTRFCAFYGTAHHGAIAYATGYTGLGVGASRFGAQVMLDLLDGRSTERTRLQMVRRRPLPFPPEPLAYVGIQATRWSLARADAQAGRRNVWLRALDRAGLGFDS